MTRLDCKMSPVVLLIMDPHKFTLAVLTPYFRYLSSRLAKLACHLGYSPSTSSHRVSPKVRPGAAAAHAASDSDFLSDFLPNAGAIYVPGLLSAGPVGEKNVHSNQRRTVAYSTRDGLGFA